MLGKDGAPLVVRQRAPALRKGGYVIDFWGFGYDLAERMGLIGEINHTGYHVQEVRIVDDKGRRLAGFGTRVFEELTGGRGVAFGGRHARGAGGRHRELDSANGQHHPF